VEYDGAKLLFELMFNGENCPFVTRKGERKEMIKEFLVVKKLVKILRVFKKGKGLLEKLYEPPELDMHLNIVIIN